MKKLVWVFCALFVLMACHENKTQETVDENVAVRDTVESDTLDVVEAEEALPARADELFDDFIYDFSSDSGAQLARTYFPFPYTVDSVTTPIKKREWEHDPLFSVRDFYTVIFNNEEEMQYEKDTSLTQVRLEILDLDKKRAKRYQFKRYQGIGVWCLYGVKEEDWNEELDAVEFMDFYRQFASDSTYQREHVHEPLRFVTIDPDDDFSIIETSLEVELWFAFRPQLPLHELTNVNYGQAYVEEVNTKTLCFHGCQNGINNILNFEKRDGEWMLMSFEDTSY